MRGVVRLRERRRGASEGRFGAAGGEARATAGRDGRRTPTSDLHQADLAVEVRQVLGTRRFAATRALRDEVRVDTDDRERRLQVVEKILPRVASRGRLRTGRPGSAVVAGASFRLSTAGAAARSRPPASRTQEDGQRPDDAKDGPDRRRNAADHGRHRERRRAGGRRHGQKASGGRLRAEARENDLQEEKRIEVARESPRQRQGEEDERGGRRRGRPGGRRPRRPDRRRERGEGRAESHGSARDRREARDVRRRGRAGGEDEENGDEEQTRSRGDRARRCSRATRVARACAPQWTYAQPDPEPAVRERNGAHGAHRDTVGLRAVPLADLTRRGTRRAFRPTRRRRGRRRRCHELPPSRRAATASREASVSGPERRSAETGARAAKSADGLLLRAIEPDVGHLQEEVEEAPVRGERRDAVREPDPEPDLTRKADRPDTAAGSARPRSGCEGCRCSAGRPRTRRRRSGTRRPRREERPVWPPPSARGCCRRPDGRAGR